MTAICIHACMTLNLLAREQLVHQKNTFADVNCGTLAWILTLEIEIMNFQPGNQNNCF